MATARTAHYVAVDLTDVEKGEPELMDAAERTMRQGFVRKVFGILAAQLLLTAAIAAPIVGHAATKAFVLSHPALPGVCSLASLVLLLAFTFSETARERHPTNLYLLAAFTAAEGVVVGSITAHYALSAVLLAVVVTAVVTTGLALYALNTRRDFTTQAGLLLAGLLALLATGLLAALTRSPALHLLAAGGGGLLFGCFIVFDVQLIVGGKHTSVQLSPDQYVMGAIQVYLDVINLFLYILRFINELQRD